LNAPPDRLRDGVEPQDGRGREKEGKGRDGKGWATVTIFL